MAQRKAYSEEETPSAAGLDAQGDGEMSV